ncbi:hypothetical protein BATDEDRAFT_28314 [Batrachochytrium dendrobatidis JAM81]|uniref:Phosphodiesterase n=2 Tax=Batrachochytrium dendrobatidis TaxID=109871 RepID=F4PDN5_BATDJ|nr:uncharacterized protein BATDEDRAFT_28314 [Batrachochytrium dendrobatidis JAM81]EGF76813.1 hypothetical protein BATDEDRAFT_28314 [Batrachochytrium dendrobatidis JAM81]OAJ45161.1 3'5'-cyclic nucleotide phosphodiesterase [Batrachochytrium dendrobatidis JEL423]|eukprot:XP_006682624.1 hypothetical protein BATDEDRAFT_28314 [Batrachochytrium dendrobatidis JAM81]
MPQPGIEPLDDTDIPCRRVELHISEPICHSKPSTAGMSTDIGAVVLQAKSLNLPVLPGKLEKVAFPSDVNTISANTADQINKLNPPFNQEQTPADIALTPLLSQKNHLGFTNTISSAVDTTTLPVSVETRLPVQTMQQLQPSVKLLPVIFDSAVRHGPMVNSDALLQSASATLCSDQPTSTIMHKPLASDAPLYTADTTHQNSSARIIHIQIPTATAFVTESIEISNTTSYHELVCVLMAAAGISDSDIDFSTKITKAGVWLTDTNGRHLELDAKELIQNSKETPYILQIDRPNDTFLVSKEPIHAAELSKIIQPITDLATKSSDVVRLRNSLKKLRKKMDRMDVDKLNFGKPYSMLTKLPSSHTSTMPNPNYPSDAPRYIFTEHTKEWLKSPTFDNWQWDDNELLGLFELMFVEMGLVEEFKIDLGVLRRFLSVVRENYNNNPFHNFKHSFCVTQMMYGLINVTKLIDKLKPVEKLILTVACIGHDLDHPGYNNSYQINAKTEMAIVYNDNAPLEMHHAAFLFGILKRPDCNIFAGFSDSVYREARRGIIRCILSTDMAKHGDLLAQFKKVSDSFNYDDAENRALLISLVIKCADISNEVRPPSVAEPWVNCLLEEFFSQSDREKADGLPNAPFMDREKVTKPSAQIGFIAYVMIPMYELVGKVLPNMDKHILHPIRASLNFYKHLLEKEKAEK